MTRWMKTARPFRGCTVFVAMILSGVTQIQSAAIAEDDYSLLFRGGSSYYRVPGQSLFGGAYSLETAFPIGNDVGLTVSGNVNHLSGGTQFSGSTGLVKLPAQRPASRGDSITAAVVFDQFTDNRVNTFTGSFYTSQLCWQGGYQIEPDLEIGVSGSVPLYRTDDVLFRFVNFPGSLPVAGVVAGSVSCGAYVTGHSGAWQQAIYAGFRELPGTAQLASSTRYRIDERIAAIAGGTFEERHSNWNVYFGLEIDLGRRRTSRQRGRSIRAQSPAAPVHTAGYVPPGNVDSDPENEIREFPLNLGEDSIQPPLNLPDPSVSNQPVTPPGDFPMPLNVAEIPFAIRWKNWDGKLELNRSERDIQLGHDGKGLANRVQDLIQAGPSGGYIWGPGYLNGRLQD